MTSTPKSTSSTSLLDFAGALLIASLVVALVYFLYWPGVHGPRMLDDDSVLKILLALQQHRDWGTVMLILHDGNVGSAHRPIAMLTFIANFLISGGDFPPFKLTNIAIHLACGGAVYFFLLQILRRLDIEQARASALFMSLLWLCLPIQVSTVLYVVQRMAQLVTLFTLLCLGFYLLWRRRLSQGQRAWGSLAACLISAVLALLSKENAALIAPFILILEFFILLPSEDNAALRRRITHFCVGMTIVGVALSAWILIYHGQSLMHYENRDFTLTQRLLTEPRVLIDYLHQIFLPDLAEIGVFHDDYPVSTRLWQPWTTLPALLTLLALAVAAWLARRRLPLFAFGIAFFAVGQSMESSFISLELYFDHRNYLPCIGLILALFGLLHGIKRHRRLILTVALIYLLAMALLTRFKAGDFASLDVMMYTNLPRHPHSHRLLSVITEKSAYEGRWDVANFYARKMIAEPGVFAATSYIEYFGLLCREGRQPLPADLPAFAHALDEQRRSLSYMTSSLDFINGIFEEHHCQSPGFAAYARTMADWQWRYFARLPRRERENNWSLRLYIAQALMDQQQWPQAEDLYADMWQSHLVSIAGLDLAQLQCKMGQYDACARTLSDVATTQTDAPPFAQNIMHQLAREIYAHQHHPARQK